MNTRGCHAALCLLAFSALLITTLLAGCGGEKKIERIPVGAMESYRDPAMGFHLQHPKGWVVDGQVGRVHFYNTQGVDMKFRDPLGSYPDGVVIAVDVTRTPTPDAEMNRLVADMKSIGMVLKDPLQVTVDGRPATKILYTAKYSAQVMVTGYHIFVPADSLLYDLGYAGFGDLREAYATIADSSLASFEFPKQPEAGVDATLPSSTMAQYDAKLFTFEYPDNFNFTNPPKGSNELVVELRGVRQDCSIRFDVFGAKGNTAEKVFNQNRAKIKSATSGKRTIDGQSASYLTYAPTKDVERMFTFVVKDDKVYRVTMDWFKPQREEYLATYLKVLNSIKFK